MGDGRVALILDVPGVAQTAHITTEPRDTQTVNAPSDDLPVENRETLLLLRLGEGHRLAIPFDAVQRLEEIPANRVESVGDEEVIQYRDEILPIVNLGRVLNRAVPKDPKSLQLVVCSDGQRQVGLVVNEILDIVEEVLNVKRRRRSRGILGSAVVQERITELLDIEGLIDDAYPPSSVRPKAVHA